LLWKNQFIVLFIILELISLVLLTQSYSYHGSIAYNTTSNISGSIFSSYSNLTDYLDLKEENDILAEENAILKNLLISSYNITDTNYVYRDTNYRYQKAKVVQNSNTKANNFLIVNKGKKHGILTEMGVISPTGLAGIVIGTSDNYSTVMSMLHSEMRVSARIKKSGQLVNVIWGINDYKYGTVIDIPSHISLSKGDTIVTSGNSLIFPEDILIGTIEEHQPDLNKNLSSATLKFGTDFNSLGYVYIIENIQKPELDSLIQQTVSNEK
jgi:rod shape-determining protein MreC